MKWTRVIPIFIGLLGGCLIGYQMKKSSPVEARRILFYRDPMHPAYRSDKPGVAPDCGMQLEPVYADGLAASLSSGPDLDAEGAVIAPATQRLYGIRVVPVTSGAQQSRVRLFGRVEPDQTRIYSIEFGTDGYVKETHSDSIGTHVAKNQKLATVYSPEFLTVAGGYLAANERFPNSATSAKEAPSTASQNSASVAARADRLRNLGVSDFQIEEMTRDSKLPEDIYLVSPTDGFILSRNISPGMRFERHAQLYTIADLSHVWIMADAFGRDSQLIHMGMKARITVPETDLTTTAVVTSVLPAVDPATRSLSIRLECDNPSVRLRPGMFVNVELAVELPPGLTVPVDSIVDTGTSRRLYVRADDSHFVPRVVQTGWQNGDRIQVLGGLHEGESVVSDGTFLVDSEARLHGLSRPAIGTSDMK
jgi:Cu(I)/Ag(I) efflux system membrane fusion protein